MFDIKLLQPEVSDASEILHLKLWEGTAFDYSLNGNDGALTGTTLTYRYPGLDLEGADEHIVVTDAVAFTPALTPFSISAWVYMHDATMFTIASKGVYNTDGEWDFRLSAVDKIFIRQMDESVANCYIGRSYNTALTSYENQWIHLAATSDGGILSAGSKIYLNGTRIDDSDSESNAGSFITVEDLNHDVWIGRYDTDYTNGLIDDVRIYNTERTAVQIKDFYEQNRWRYSV